MRTASTGACRHDVGCQKGCDNLTQQNLTPCDQINTLFSLQNQPCKNNKKNSYV
jgi:hypothetical protein